MKINDLDDLHKLQEKLIASYQTTYFFVMYLFTKNDWNNLTLIQVNSSLKQGLKYSIVLREG